MFKIYIIFATVKLEIMKVNMGTLDKVIRIVLALVVIGLYAVGQISGTAAIILLVFAGIFIVTSFIGFCPLYTIFGINTKKS